MRFIALIMLTVSIQAHATVVEFEDSTAEKVIKTYEEMREPESPQWIHAFETESIGTEMDHLTKMKQTAQAEKQLND